MSRRATRAAAVALALGAGLTALAAARPTRPALPFYEARGTPPVWTAARARRVGDWTLTDQDSQRVSARDLDGTIYVASFFFTTCEGYCPTLRSNLARVADAFVGDRRVAILSHTALPEIDDVPKLAEYARVNHIVAPQWRLLTGSRAAIADLARGYLIELSDSTARRTMVHSETFVLVDGQRRIRGVYDGTLGFDVTQLIADIRTLQAAANSNTRSADLPDGTDVKE